MLYDVIDFDVDKEIRKNKINLKYHTNLKHNLSVRLRTRFSIALKQQNIIKNKTIIQYGINIKDILEYLGLCPGDRKSYHVDHIKPLSLFDLSDENEIRKAFAPENHQWLESKENLRKGNKYETDNKS